MPVPNFVLIGAAKSGTTSLFRYLSQHPDVFACPTKEPRFFAYEGRRAELRPGDPFLGQIVFDWGEYVALFSGVRTERAIGEASVVYLPSPTAPERIFHYLPEAKVVAILRNPVDRAYSHYNYFRANKIEPCGTFMEALRDEPRRESEGWYLSFCYQLTGFYARHLARYDARVPAHRLKVVLYDDLRADPVATVRSVFRFLEVDEAFVPDVSVRHNVTSRVARRRSSLDRLPRRWIPRSLRSWTRSRQPARRVPPMDAATRQFLASVYRKDVEALQERLGRDLSHWL